ncbi:O-methyltransferase, family 3 [Candidatus Magnetomorum sp. HK-1]|nr:O-methyltransferase, family 3 [Candidatus Magnetomorum sp. HK-1]
MYGDARQFLECYTSIAFCFLDGTRDIYEDCYEKIVKRLVKNGLLIIDNALNNGEILVPMLQPVLADERVNALIIPIGQGELVCRKL